MAKRRIQVHTAFNLKLPGNEKGESLRELHFIVGPHEVEDEVADHRYAKNFYKADEVEAKSEPVEEVEADEVETDEDDDKQDSRRKKNRR